MNHLIIFMRSPVLGKVKKRIGAVLGDEAALDIYTSLYTHTLKVADKLPYKKWLFLAGEITELKFENSYHIKYQSGEDLGYRMLHAIESCLKKEPGKAVLIGTDCPEIDQHIISSAFEYLNDNDVVLGPASDGGYYLIGMNTPYSQLFMNKEWGGPDVFIDTVADILEMDLKWIKLPVLYDVDTVEDARRAGFHDKIV